MLSPPNHEDEDDVPPLPASSSIASSTPICPLRSDEDLTSMAALTAILYARQHQSCGTCLVRWMEREESSGRREVGPTCTFCRVVMSECDVLRLMGRPFRPRLLEVAAVGEDESYVQAGTGPTTSRRLYVRAKRLPKVGLWRQQTDVFARVSFSDPDANSAGSGGGGGAMGERRTYKTEVS
jgi:hypothetical protein